MRMLLAGLLTLTLAIADASAAGKNLDDGTALKGFDAVSYFDGVPRMGRKGITFEYQGTVYRFHSERNRERFARDPARYPPAFGGFCAWGVLGDSDQEDISPGSWKVVDGRLLLFYKGYLGDGLRDWNDYATANGGDTVALEKATIIWNRLQDDP
jgi:hypothetical protein